MFLHLILIEENLRYIENYDTTLIDKDDVDNDDPLYNDIVEFVITTGKNVTSTNATKKGYPIISGGVEPLGYYPLKNRDGNKVTIASQNKLLLMIDKDYLLASMGLLSKIDPLLALKIMKKHLVLIS